LHQFRKLESRKGLAGSNPASSAMVNFFKKNKKEPKNLKDVLSVLSKLKENIDKTSKELVDFKKESKKNLQKVGLIRFNPFREIGGDQSFSIALLDAENNGFIVTSLYGREANRIYAKKITRGASSHTLSKEEKQALTKAMKG
jgi:hypothetical protein